MPVARVAGVATVKDWEIGLSGTLSINPGAGSDRFLLGSMSGLHLFSGSAPTHVEMRYGGSGGTLMTSQGATTTIDGVFGTMQSFYAVNGPTAASDLYALFSTVDPQRINICGVAYTGVDQASPYSGYTVNAPAGTSGVTTMVASVTIPDCVAGQVAVAHFHAYSPDVSLTLPTAVADSTLVAAAIRTDVGEADMSAVAVVEKIAAADGSVTIQVNLNASVSSNISYVAKGMRLNAAGGGGAQVQADNRKYGRRRPGRGPLNRGRYHINERAEALAPTHQLLQLGQVTETDLAQAIAARHILTIGQVNETDLAQAISSNFVGALGQVNETDLAQAIAARHIGGVGQVTETDVSQAISVLLQSGVGQVSETDLAQAISARHISVLGQVLETDLAQPFTVFETFIGEAVKAWGRTNQHPGRGPFSTGRFHIQQRAEALAVPEVTTVALGQVSETDTAQPIGGRLIGAVSQVTETDLAQSIAARHVATLGQVSETDLAQAVTVVRRLTVGQVNETDLAQPITGRQIQVIAQVLETDLAQALTPSGTGIVTQVSETDIAQAITAIQARLMGQTSETDAALAITPSQQRALAQVTETDLAQAVTVVRRLTVTQNTEVDSALAITPLHRQVLGQVNETDLAQDIVSPGVTLISQVQELDLALAITTSTVQILQQVMEVDTAQPMSFILFAAGRIVRIEAESRSVIIVPETRNVPFS